MSETIEFKRMYPINHLTGTDYGELILIFDSLFGRKRSFEMSALYKTKNLVPILPYQTIKNLNSDIDLVFLSGINKDDILWVENSGGLTNFCLINDQPFYKTCCCRCYCELNINTKGAIFRSCETDRTVIHGGEVIYEFKCRSLTCDDCINKTQ